MKKLISMLCGLCILGMTLVSASDASCQAKYPETVYRASDNACICPTDTPRGWNKYTYCSLKNGAKRITTEVVPVEVTPVAQQSHSEQDISCNAKYPGTTYRASDQMCVCPNGDPMRWNLYSGCAIIPVPLTSINSNPTISTSSNTREAIRIKVQDNKCKKQNSSRYYNNNLKACVASDQSSNLQTELNTKSFDIYKCIDNNKREKVRLNTIDTLGSQKYYTVSRYQLNDVVYLPNGSYPQSSNCTVVSVYKCTESGWELKSKNTNDVLGEKGNPAYNNQKVGRYNNSNEYYDNQWVFVLGKNNTVSSETCDRSMFDPDLDIYELYLCEESGNRRRISKEIGDTGSYEEYNIFKDYKIDDITYIDVTNKTINSINCNNISSNSNNGSTEGEIFQENGFYGYRKGNGIIFKAKYKKIQVLYNVLKEYAGKNSNIYPNEKHKQYLILNDQNSKQSIADLNGNIIGGRDLGGIIGITNRSCYKDMEINLNLIESTSRLYDYNLKNNVPKDLNYIYYCITNPENKSNNYNFIVRGSRDGENTVGIIDLRSHRLLLDIKYKFIFLENHDSLIGIERISEKPSQKTNQEIVKLTRFDRDTLAIIDGPKLLTIDRVEVASDYDGTKIYDTNTNYDLVIQNIIAKELF